VESVVPVKLAALHSAGPAWAACEDAGIAEVSVAASEVAGWLVALADVEGGEVAD
jgi:hypothetical protein